MSLQGKRILFVAPVFHDYHTLIVNKLEAMGAQVEFYAERDYSLWFKLVNNLLHPLLSLKQAMHYRKILRRTRREHFDYLFVIRGYGMTPGFVEAFKKRNPSAKTVMYQWDSDRTNPFAGLVPFFDVVQSFDYKDCETFGIPYLPLFYTDDVAEEASKTHATKYDYFFMGTYLPERYAAVVRFRDSLPDVSRLKAFIYITPTALKKEQLRGVSLDRSIVSTRPMSRKAYLTTLNESKVVVDVSCSRQTGLAMRIIEALASRRKVLTVNEFIKNDPYYDPRNINLFDSTHPRVDAAFVNTPFYGKAGVLSIGEWLRAVLALPST